MSVNLPNDLPPLKFTFHLAARGISGCGEWSARSVVRAYQHRAWIPAHAGRKLRSEPKDTSFSGEKVEVISTEDRDLLNIV